MATSSQIKPWIDGLRPLEPPLPTTLEREDLAHCHVLTDPSSFVSEGSLTLRELGWRGHTPVIPDGESAITALAIGPNRKVYGATSGEHSHFFVYNLLAQVGGVMARPMDLGILGEERVCRAMVATQDAIYVGTTSDRFEDYRGGHLYRHRLAAEVPRWYDRHGVPPFPFKLEVGDQIEDLGILLEGEGIYTLTCGADQDTLYGLTYPSGYFFSYDLRQGMAAVKGQVGERNLSRALVRTAQGHIYGSGDYGKLFRYDPESGSLVQLGLSLPCVKGREYLNGLDSAAVAADGTIYGGTIADGFLFRFDPDHQQLVNLGKPIRQSRIRALTVGLDGRVYGFAGEPENIGRLFTYSPKTGDLRDLGILRVGGIPKYWAAYEVDAMATGPNGELFLGESDRVSHLFIYYPPILPES